MGIIAWLIVGLVAGAIARALLPGPDPMGVLGTLILGLVGSVIGGLIGNLLVSGDQDLTPRGADRLDPGGGDRTPRLPGDHEAPHGLNKCGGPGSLWAPPTLSRRRPALPLPSKT
jgi:uncharacterized membrane protein YeaQ/YmgE (transglycosylase-associated protein family)